jgi:hypothetical protein
MLAEAAARPDDVVEVEARREALVIALVQAVDVRQPDAALGKPRRAPVVEAVTQHRHDPQLRERLVLPFELRVPVAGEELGVRGPLAAVADPVPRGRPRDARGEAVRAVVRDTALGDERAGDGPGGPGSGGSEQQAEGDCNA